MCGIAGLLMRDGRPADPEMLAAMARALAHRGPDGSGQHLAGAVGLAQTRLAIIDLATGDQPLFGPDGGALVSNGEIYNYVELDAAIDPAAVRRSRSDFEPLLHLAAADGAAAVDDLRGMYAFAWQPANGDRLLLARDQFGIKPLYLAHGADAVAFASEPRALFDAGLAGREIDPEGLRILAELGFSPAGVWRGVSRMPAATRQWLGDANGRQAPPPDLRTSGDVGPAPADMGEAVRRFDVLFEDSVRIHQRSDVPYGLFLSGGLDSAAVLTMMARLNDRPVRTFTCGFAGADVHDERQDARRVAEAMGAEHAEITFSEDDFWDLLPRVAWALDDPTIDYAVLPTWKLGQAARQAGLKVVLSGEGGDEVFAGYGRYRYLQRPWWRGGRRPKIRGRLARLGLTGHLPGDWRAPLEDRMATVHRQGASRLQGAQLWDMTSGWLTDDLLLKVDRCLMAHGVEGRVPFLDGPLAAFGLGLPDRFKVADDRGKAVVRHWLAAHCPAAEAFGRKKGFTVPVGPWIARGGDGLAAVLCRNELVRTLCKPEDIQDIVRRATDGRAGMAAWTLVFLAVWHRIHVDRADASLPTAEILA